MSQVLISWKEECDAIHTEMDRLLTAGRLESAEERQVRKIQFMALIERRNVAAQNCLKSPGGGARFAINRRMLPEPPRPVTRPEPAIAPDIGPDVMNIDAFQEPSEAARATDRNPQVPAADPAPEVAIASVDLCPAPSAAAPAMDATPQAPVTNPMFDAGNFLKFLGLK